MQHGLSTRWVRAGTHLDTITGGPCSPIDTSSAFAFPNPANANIYPRYFNTPNHQVVDGKLAAPEKGEGALVFGSGHYQVPAIQEVAELVGDSSGLAQQTAKIDAEVIVFCGAHFMFIRKAAWSARAG